MSVEVELRVSPEGIKKTKMRQDKGIKMLSRLLAKGIILTVHV